MGKSLVILYRPLLSLLLLVLAPAALAQQFRILVSNDDGIESPQLAVLAEALAELPGVEVLVSAPAENQSGSSHASIGELLVVEEVERNGQLFGYAVHGRPADAVRWGLGVPGASRPFDLVVSGINRGANVGAVAHLSGTVGAAMEAMYQGVPAIAVSQHTSDVDSAASARFAAQLVQRLRGQGFPPGVVISVNIPGGEIRGVAVRRMGESYLTLGDYQLQSEEAGRATYRRNRSVTEASDPGSDTWAWQQGYITITPLRFDWTDYRYLSELQSWEWDLEGD